MLGSFSRATRSSSSNQSTQPKEPRLSCNHPSRLYRDERVLRGRWPTHQGEQRLCPVHRGFIAMSGSSGRLPQVPRLWGPGKTQTSTVLLRGNDRLPQVPRLWGPGRVPPSTGLFRVAQRLGKVVSASVASSFRSLIAEGLDSTSQISQDDHLRSHRPPHHRSLHKISQPRRTMTYEDEQTSPIAPQDSTPKTGAGRSANRGVPPPVLPHAHDNKVVTSQKHVFDAKRPGQNPKISCDMNAYFPPEPPFSLQSSTGPSFKSFSPDSIFPLSPTAMTSRFSGWMYLAAAAWASAEVTPSICAGSLV